MPKSDMTHPTARAACAALAAATLMALSACGYREGLERPAPMWGEAREQYEREEAARREAEEAAKAEAPAPAPN